LFSGTPEKYALVSTFKISSEHTLEEGRSLQLMVLGKVDTHVQKNETRSLLNTLKNTKWIKDLKVNLKLCNYYEKTGKHFKTRSFWIGPKKHRKQK
jgi:hypothetical protein